MNIFAIGDLNPDIFVYSEKSPKRGIEQKVDCISASIGGNAANFSMALSGLGVKTSLISMGAEDSFSSFLKQELARAGVKPLLIKSKNKNAASVIFVSKDGERAIMSSKAALLEMDCKKVSKILLPNLMKGDIVFFGGFFHLPKMKSGFPKLLSAIKKKGASIFFDLCYDEYGSWKIPALEKIDALFLNELELKMLTKSAAKKKAIAKLFSRGSSIIVLKKGKNGAELFSGNRHLESRAIPVKALNATAAGDFFNAGYAYAFSKGYGEKASLECANFVAAEKISNEGYQLTSAKKLESHLAPQNFLELKKFNSYDLLSRAIAGEIMLQLKKKPASVISLAAGSTPLGAYRELAKAYREGSADFSKAYFVELDEYCGIRNYKDSFAYSLGKNFLGKVNFKKKNILLFNPDAKNKKKEIARFENFIRKKGLDFVLLGIGANCHIAFNEPGTRFSSSTHVEKLKHRAVSKSAFTLGIRTILSAKKIILAASGSKKAMAIRKTFSSKPDEKIPSSVLQKHRNASAFVDSAAGKLV